VLAKWRPPVSVASLSGPSLAAVVMSVPCTVNETGSGSELPGLPMFAGIVICRSVSDSPPVAAVTPRSLAIPVTVASLSAPPPSPVSVSMVCAPFVHLPLLQTSAPLGPIVTRVPAEEPGLNGGGALVTVMSVPTPYNPLSTPAWAFCTPLDAAVTVTTRPTPTARPSAMNTACRLRRPSSRAR